MSVGTCGVLANPNPITGQRGPKKQSRLHTGIAALSISGKTQSSVPEDTELTRQLAERDSNPRYGYPYNGFRVLRFSCCRVPPRNQLCALVWHFYFDDPGLWCSVPCCVAWFVCKSVCRLPRWDNPQHSEVVKIKRLGFKVAAEERLKWLNPPHSPEIRLIKATTTQPTD
jgi:hypothetical protein